MLAGRFQRRAAMAAMMAVLALPALAQQYPTRPIKIIVAFGAGGTADTIARLYGQKISEILGSPVIIENKPGGNQLLAIRALQSSSPDGHTLYAATGSSLVQNPAVHKGLPYDPLKDFSLLGLAVTNPAAIFVNPDLLVRSVGEFVAYARTHPGELNYGTAGVGTAGHFHVEAFMSMTGVTLTHIPFKSGADVARETMTGTVQFGIMPTLDTVPFINAGKIRALAVETAQRLPYLPDVPALTETDIKGLTALEPHTFIAFVGPANMPPAVVAKLNGAINQVSGMPEVARRVREGLFAEPATSTPSGFREFLEKEIAKWRILGKTVNLPDP